MFRLTLILVITILSIAQSFPIDEEPSDSIDERILSRVRRGFGTEVKEAIGGSVGTGAQGVGQGMGSGVGGSAQGVGGGMGSGAQGVGKGVGNTYSG